MAARSRPLAIGGRLRRSRRLLWKFAADQRGNVLVILGFSFLPMVIAVGMSIDYGRAMKLETKLSAAADAAALVAVSHSMIGQSWSIAQSAAQTMFEAQTNGLPGLVINYNDPTQFSVTGGDTPFTTTKTRTATVMFNGQSTNAFAGILGLTSLTVRGTSASTGSLVPNIDFYLVLDTSPSMAIAATQSGINTLVAATPQQGGCAFACHQTYPNTNDNAGNPIDPNTGKIMDNYALARSLNVVLRTDLVTQAAANLMDVAASTASVDGATYRMSISTIDTAFNTVTTSQCGAATGQTLATDLSCAKTKAAAVSMLTVFAENYLTSSNYNSDTDTNFTAMESGLGNIVAPVPGQGTNVSGDTPQEIIFLVTDGVRDETLVSGGRSINEIQRPYSSTFPPWCTTIKATGIRIAVLYTNYLPLPTNSFYNSNVGPWQSNIAPDLSACASPGLFYEVTTGDDISAALSSLFAKAVATTYLTQ